MMYMDDAVKATLQLMEAPAAHVKVRSSYNVTGMSFCPAEVAKEIQKFIPDFEISYAPDFRQAIADSWPKSINDTPARIDWGWEPSFDLDDMAADILKHLPKLLAPAS
jgi:nucleoside-diphosphate-sugar epimerase